jgi:ferritin-like metal-binding protein YciE
MPAAQPKMEDPRELLMHELQDLLYVEKTLIKALPKLAKEATDEELRAGFEQHLKETEQHAANLEQVFELLGEKAKAEKCPGIDGIKAEHDEFIKEEKPAPEICDLFLTGAGSRAEHYEIAGYTGAITMAQALGETDAVPLLEENLKQEQAALAKLEKAAQRLSRAQAVAA